MGSWWAAAEGPERGKSYPKEGRLRDGNLSAESDEDLAAKAREGDEGRVEELFGRCRPRLCRWLEGQVTDRALAEDLAQESLVRAYESLQRYDREKGLFRTWLLSIARHVLLDYYDRRSRRLRPVSTEDLEEEATEARDAAPAALHRHEEHSVLVAWLLGRLPAKLYLPVAMFYEDRMSYAEIARRLEVDESTVRYRLAVAHKMMRRWLKERSIRSSGDVVA